MKSRLAYLDEYLAVAGIRDHDKTPLFRSAAGRTGILTDRPMHRVDAYEMVRRRTAEAGFKGKLGCHVFRATGITAYLEASGTLENAQAMAAHESPRTTKLYDRTGDEITLDEVERITIWKPSLITWPDEDARWFDALLPRARNLRTESDPRKIVAMNFLSRWFRRLPKAPSWIAPEALARRLGRESALLIIDVRSPDEFTGPLGHIREATNMPLNELPAQQLQEAGMSDVSVLRGGMEQWRVLGLPARWEALEGSQFVPKHHWIDAAIGWVDAVAHPPDREDAPLRAARTRVLAEDIRALRAIPTSGPAALDGFAVQASASLGASAYNPIRLPLIAVVAGDVLPAGTDAVVPLELAEPDERACIEIVEAVAVGQNVEQQGAIATIGATLVPAGTQLAARHIGLLAIAGLFRVPVVRRPRVRILLAKPVKAGAWEDSNGPMIRAAVERDGGVVGECVEVERDLMAIRAALVEAGVDIVLVIGGTGPGIDDHSAAALAEAGELAIHGVALRPGETTGLGRTVSGVPVVLLPGAPAACLWSYELFAGRAIRRFGGRGPDLPYRSREMITARKIVSAIGMTEICPVRCGAGDNVEPLPSFAETGLMAAVGADGFVIIPEGSEGHPQGARVTVYLYEGC